MQKEKGFIVMKRAILFILVAALAVCRCAGCGEKAEQASSAPSASPEQTAEAATRTITDMVGRTVEIPATVEKIVPLGNTPRLITYLGLADKAVGIGECEHATSPIQAYAFINKDLWANLPNVGTDAMGETAYYAEEIIKVAPDVILSTYTKDVADDIQKQTNIPVVSVAAGNLFQKDFDDALLMLGDVCGVEKRAEEIITYISECLNDLKTRTADISEADKPLALAAAATFKGVHGIEGVYTNYPVFSTIGVKDAAQGVSETVGGVLVDKEKILEWNPQIIFFDSEGVKLVKEDYGKSPDYYKQLQAVNEGNLYQYPNSTYHWTNVEIPLANAYYIGSLLYPDQFKDIVVKDKANEIFKFFLGDDNYLSKLEAAGAGYGKVDLGA